MALKDWFKSDAERLGRTVPSLLASVSPTAAPTVSHDSARSQRLMERLPRGADVTGAVRGWSSISLMGANRSDLMGDGSGPRWPVLGLFGLLRRAALQLSDGPMDPHAIGTRLLVPDHSSAVNTRTTCVFPVVRAKRAPHFRPVKPSLPIFGFGSLSSQSALQLTRPNSDRAHTASSGEPQ